MIKKHLIFVPGKSPKPSAKDHKVLLWKTLLEGIHRVEPDVANEIESQKECFHIVAWNYSYYHENTIPDRESIDSLLHQDGPTPQDIIEASSWMLNFHRFIYTVIDYVPWLLRWLPESAKLTIEETKAYFENHDNIGYEIRGMLKSILRPLLDNNEPVLIIGHSLGSVIVYDTLWELSHNEVHSGKVDFLSLGSPLGLQFVQNKLQGRHYPNKSRYPLNIRNWINLSSEGDVTAVDRRFADDFSYMVKQGLVDSIEDHCEDIYNFYHNEEGLDCHSSYGYLVNPAVGKIIANWWHKI